MNLRTELMNHQAAAVDKVLPSCIGALFCEMGTGKSRAAIELVFRRIEKIDHVLWFCPVSLKETIRQEILKHIDCTDADICVFDDHTSEKNLPMTLWYVVGIESMSLSARVTLAVNKLITSRTFVILDESSYIKGHNAMRTMRITKLCERARYRLILTGTPLSQGVVDLFAQMRFLSPKILGYNSFYSFAANHLEYSEKYPGMIVRAHNIGYLAAKIKPYVYQVTKEECLDLPEKIYTTRYLSMTDEQREYYNLAKEEILAELLNKDDFSSIAIFRLFTVLQEIICGFWNRRDGRGNFNLLEFPHDRTDTLLTTIQSIPAGEKAIIWTKYQHDIACVERALKEDFGEDSVALFYGGLSERKRSEQVERFRGPARFFLATQSCGGHGLTLNEAHYVIFYNNAFKYSERLQAEDRCILEGQSIMTTKGWVPIESLSIGDEVIGHDCMPHKVTDIWSRRAKGSHAHNTKVIAEINVRGWPWPLKMTDDHSVLTLNGWVPAAALRPGDKMLMPAPVNGKLTSAIPFRSDCRVPEYFQGHGGFQRNGRLVNAPDQVYLGNEAMFAFGYYIGDGFASVVSGKGRFVSFAGNRQKKRVSLERCRDWVYGVGVNCSLDENPQKDNGAELRAYSAEWAFWFEAEFGRTLNDKHLPPWLFSLAQSQRRAFLEGWLASDGYMRSSKSGALRYEIITASKRLACGAVRLIAGLGLKPCLTLGTTGQFLIQFTEGVEQTLTVTSIKLRLPQKTERVWDITIDGAETFVLGSAVVHNCHRIGQEHKVTYIDIHCSNSIDDRIASALASKGNVVEAFKAEVEKVKDKKTKLKELVKKL